MARASSIEQGLAPQRVMPTMPQGSPVLTGSVVKDSRTSLKKSKELHHEDAMMMQQKCCDVDDGNQNVVMNLMVHLRAVSRPPGTIPPGTKS